MNTEMMTAVDQIKGLVQVQVMAGEAAGAAAEEATQAAEEARGGDGALTEAAIVASVMAAMTGVHLCTQNVLDAMAAISGQLEALKGGGYSDPGRN